jgi:hypothetical protein
LASRKLTPVNDIPRLDPTDVSIFVVPADPEEDIPEMRFTIAKFKFLKALLVLETLAELGRRIDIGALFVGGTLKLDTLIDLLPTLMMTMRPAITKALALTLMKNKDLEELVDSEIALDEALEAHRRVVHRLDFAKAAELLAIGIERIGVQDIKQNFPTLVGALRAS